MIFAFLQLKNPGRPGIPGPDHSPTAFVDGIARQRYRAIMRLRHFANIAIPFLALVVGGCIPATYIQVPALRGRVVDPDGRPVNHAAVEVAGGDGTLVGAVVYTGPSGTFSRPEQSSFIFVIPAADMAANFYSVTATDGKRRSATTQVSDDVRIWFMDPPADRNLGDLQLR
jgi:hypothetical protein